MRWVLLFSVLATPVSAAEYMHCYLREAPEDAPLSTGPNLSGLMGALQIASLKHACGAETAADQDMLNAIVARGECSPESEIAGYVSETFAFEPDVLMADFTAQTSEAMMGKLCEATKQCDPGSDGYTETCRAGIDAAMEE